MSDIPTIWSLFEERTRADSGHEFGVDDSGRRFSFGEMHRAAIRLACQLEARGVRTGSVVAWQFPNQLEAIALSLALSRLGAIQVPLIAILREREVRFICTQSKATTIVVPPGPVGAPFRAIAETILAENPSLDVLVAPEDTFDGLDRAPTATPSTQNPTDPHTTSWYFYTSGTTADPKGARHTDASMIAGADGFVEALSLTDADRVSLIIPVTHVGGIIHLIATLATGAPILTAAAFNPRRTIEFLRNERSSTVPGSMPFVHAYFALVEEDPSLEPLFPHARLMTHGGSPKPPQLHYRAKERFGTAGIVSGYGMTECPMSIWNRPEDADEDLANTEGYPVSGVALRIVDADGHIVQTGNEGEIRLRGPQLMQGYVDASLDAEAFDEDGFFRSGDLGVVDARGRLRVTGRLKDIIIRNMENISALEIENLVFTHPKVKEVAVIGVPDERTGERVCAVVVPTDSTSPPTLKEIVDHLAATGLSTRKYPERLELIDALPRNAMEKVRKVDLRARFG